MIRLHCSYAGAPCCDWDAQLTFAKIGGQLRVTGKSTGNAGTDRLRRSLRLPRSLPFWRVCAEFLVSLKPDWALPAEAADYIWAKGCSELQSDILAICWARIDDEKEVSIGKDVLQLETRTLRRVASQLGAIRENQLEWYEALTRIANAQTALGRKSNPAKLLNSRLSRHAELETVISDLESEVDNLQDCLDDQIELHKEALEPIVKTVLGSFPSGGHIAMSSYDFKRKELLQFLVSEMLRKRIAPENVVLENWKPSS